MLETLIFYVHPHIYEYMTPCNNKSNFDFILFTLHANASANALSNYKMEFHFLNKSSIPF